MKMKFSSAFKFFLVSMCCTGLLITVFSLPYVKNVRAQMETEMEIDMEDIMESIQESIQEDVKQTIKQQVRQETTEVISENIVQPTVATTGDPTITSTTTSCDLTGTWLETGGNDFNSSEAVTFFCTQTGSSVSCSGSSIIETFSISGSLTNPSTCAYSLSWTAIRKDGTCTDSGTVSATLSEDGNTLSLSATTTGGSGTAIGCGDPKTDSGTFTKQ